MNFKIVGLVAIAAAFAVQAYAHHSFAPFDQERIITVSGTLKEFEWKNPHCWLHVVAVDATSGRAVDWSFEMGSVSQISEQGWKADSVKPGDKITVIAHPLKSGSHGGQYQIARLSDGRTLKHPDAREP
jgi:Family of unknown function (DUF6152)